MLSVVVQVRRAPHLTREEFQTYWRERHAPLVTSVPEFMRHVQRYCQYHPAEGANEAFFGSESDYDGIAVLWFESEEAAAAAFGEPEYLARIKPDEESFVDLENCRSVMVHEHVVWGGGALYTQGPRDAGGPFVRAFQSA